MSKPKRTAPVVAAPAIQPRYDLASALAIEHSNARMNFPVPPEVQAVIDAAKPDDLAEAKARLEAALQIETPDEGDLGAGEQTTETHVTGDEPAGGQTTPES